MVLLKKAVNFLRAVWSFVRRGDAPLALHDRRQTICLCCEHLRPTKAGVFCIQCRCPHWPVSDLRTKWRMRDVKCPLNKW
jgi:hypothetical protein